MVPDPPLIRFAAVRRLLPYGLAISAVGAVLVAKDLLPGGGDRPFLLLGAAVAIASYFGGRGPGLLATVAGAFAVDLLYLNPVGALSVDLESEAWLAAFALEGLVITLATDTLRRARSEARAMASRERLAREVAEAALQVRDTSDLHPRRDPGALAHCNGLRLSRHDGSTRAHRPSRLASDNATGDCILPKGQPSMGE